MLIETKLQTTVTNVTFVAGELPLAKCSKLHLIITKVQRNVEKSYQTRWFPSAGSLVLRNFHQPKWLSESAKLTSQNGISTSL